ncbi:MAG: hypothetical protein R3C39_03550 [Dehalococcoidia bacterium]
MIRMSRRLSAALAAVVGLALPAAAAAAEGGRALERPGDWTQVMVITGLSVIALFLVASIGRLYQMRRSLHWRFQDPDDGDHGGAH